MGDIRIATEKDIDKVKGFLDKSEVSSAGVESMIDHFIIMEDEYDAVQATLGIEKVEMDGLLRSLVVTSNIKQTEILSLFKSAISLAKHKGLRELYLVTNREASVVFFTMLGFSQIEKKDIAETILNAEHMKQVANADNAIYMKTTLN
jgi:N-acetylglutamate synthase-like GNAT family acetyltransferase